MLSDLYHLEQFYGPADALAVSDVVFKKYGPARLYEAIQRGDIEGRRLNCGSMRGRYLIRLTDQGRVKCGNRYQSETSQARSRI